MADIWMDVDAAVVVPVNLLPLLDDTDFKSIETAVVYNSAGMALVWNFVTTAGVCTATAVTPTTAGDYDWAEPIADKGMYTIEIPASAGASINNDTEGFGWFTGVATGVLPWRGPVIGFRAAGLNNLLIDTAYGAAAGLAGTDLAKIYSDTAGIAPVYSDTAGIAPIYSDTTIIASQVLVVKSAASDTLSAVTKVLSDTTAIHSDTTAVQTQVTTIASDLVIVTSDTTAVQTQTDKLAFTVANQVDANSLKIGGTTQTGYDIGLSLQRSDGVAFFGTISDVAPAVGDFDLSADFPADCSVLIGMWLVITSATLAHQVRKISNAVGRNVQFTGAAGATDAPWSSVPANGVTVVVLARAP